MALHKDAASAAPDKFLLLFAPEDVNKLVKPLLSKGAGSLAIKSFDDSGESDGGHLRHPKEQEIWDALYSEQAAGLVTTFGIQRAGDPRDLSKFWSLASSLSQTARHRSKPLQPLPQLTFVDREIDEFTEGHLIRTGRGYYNMLRDDTPPRVLLPVPTPAESAGIVEWPGAQALTTWLGAIAQANVIAPPEAHA